MKAVVVHSGGMDSSLCLYLATKEFWKEEVLSLSFYYKQRHRIELQQAAKIAAYFGVAHKELPLESIPNNNALMDETLEVMYQEGTPNTLVLGRNGLMAHIAALHAHTWGASCIYMGVMEREGYYRDCSKQYMQLIQSIIRLDLNDPSFEVKTPLIDMTKQETMILAHELGILDYLWKETISCYHGLPEYGCRYCPSCLLRNKAYEAFLLCRERSLLPHAEKLGAVSK